MTAEEIALRVVEILNAHDTPYMLVGSLSTNFHSIVRSTKDADVVITGDLVGTACLIAREFPMLKLDPQFGFESVTGTKRVLLRADEGEEFVVELFEQSDDAHDRERFRRRIPVDWLGRPTWIATAEDAVITKIRWAHVAGRQKDLADVRNIIGVRGESLDWPYIENWCDQHGSRALLDSIRAELKTRLRET
jgi:hypothetical protein